MKDEGVKTVRECGELEGLENRQPPNFACDPPRYLALLFFILPPSSFILAFPSFILALLLQHRRQQCRDPKEGKEADHVGDGGQHDRR